MPRTATDKAQVRRAAIVESSADAIVSIDLAGVVRDWNPAAEDLFGYTAAEVIGQSNARVVPEDRAHEPAWLLEHLKRGEAVRMLETVRLHKSGRRLRVEVTVSPLRDDDGALIGAVGMFRDITVSQRLQAELERSAAYLQSVLAGMDSGILLSDASGRVVYANRPLGELSGVPEEQAIGLPRSEFLRRQVQRLHEPEPLAAGIADAADFEGEIEFVVAQPERRVFRWWSRPVALPDGDGRLDVFRDVTAESDVRDRLARHAVTDPLTGLLNRLGGHQTLVREVARARRHSLPLSFAMIDVDHFKGVNDAYGHGVGDDVLREVTDHVTRSIRGEDALVRWGGEEFLVVLPGIPVERARELAGRLRAGVAALVVEGLPRVTVSIGVSELGPNETGPEAAIGRADERLYAAKAAGRDQVC